MISATKWLKGPLNHNGIRYVYKVGHVTKLEGWRKIHNTTPAGGIEVKISDSQNWWILMIFHGILNGGPHQMYWLGLAERSWLGLAGSFFSCYYVSFPRFSFILAIFVFSLWCPENWPFFLLNRHPPLEWPPGGSSNLVTDDYWFISRL